MSSIQFKAYSFVNELNLNLIGAHFGIQRRFAWEDYLYLNEEHLKGVLLDARDKSVILFPFGCGVFLNMGVHEVHDILNYLSPVEPVLKGASLDFSDDYRLIIDPDAQEFGVNNEEMIVPSKRNFHDSILAVVLAKSVALERIESNMEQLLDEVESVMHRLEVGKLSSRDQKIAKISANILSYKFNTISYLMLLDKPDQTWNNEEGSHLYDDLAHLFELSERYTTIEAKTRTLMDIVDVFLSFTQHKKANFLEITIIILIAVEIVFTIVDFMFYK